MDPIRYRSRYDRSANVVWNIDSTRMLVKCKLLVSGAVDGHSHCAMWIKCPLNRKGETICRLLKEEAINYVAPLQVLGDKRSENIVVAKNITLLRSAQCKDCAGGRSTYNTTIERFLRDHITNIIVHLRMNLKN